MANMAIEFSWISQPGKKTKDNRDYAGVGLRSEDALCIVLDGSTTGEGSRELGKQISHELIDWYIDSGDVVTAQAITAQLKKIHESLSGEFPFGSASYMVVHIGRAGDAAMVHAGDCLLGRCQAKNGIDWLNQPHTLANATKTMSIASIAEVPARHRLTRSFRSRDFLVPDVLEIKIDGKYLVATDGFWAELGSSDQARFIQGETVAMSADSDDRSVLGIRLLDTEDRSNARCVLDLSDNLYVKKSP